MILDRIRHFSALSERAEFHPRSAMAWRNTAKSRSVRIVAIILIVLLCPASTLHAYTEADILRESRFCEVANRLPWADVDNLAWSYCMKHPGQRVRNQDLTTLRDPDTPWMDDLRKSLLWTSEDGCENWAKLQSGDPAEFQSDGLWINNRSWNICMRKIGIFRPSR